MSGWKTPLAWALGFLPVGSCAREALVSVQVGLRKAWARGQEAAGDTMVTEQEVEAIGQTLVDPQQPLQARFRALFTLRGLGGPGAITWISRAFDDDSALLKHELAYCLGQMQDSRAIPVLLDVLRDTRQEPMVRHEAGEALGAIGNPDVLEVLKQYSNDPVIEVPWPDPFLPPPPGPASPCVWLPGRPLGQGPGREGSSQGGPRPWPRSAKPNWLPH